MKLQDLFETLAKIHNEHGEVWFQWRTKESLDGEETEGYIPDGYSKILELEEVKAVEQGKGHGDALMREFLSLSVTKRAELIFLDLSPYVGDHSQKSPIEEERIMRKLESFYKKFGFRNKRPLGRMWLVQKGKIPDKDLPG